MSISEQSIVD